MTYIITKISFCIYFSLTVPSCVNVCIFFLNYFINNPVPFP